MLRVFLSSDQVLGTYQKSYLDQISSLSNRCRCLSAYLLCLSACLLCHCLEGPGFVSISSPSSSSKVSVQGKANLSCSSIAYVAEKATYTITIVYFLCQIYAWSRGSGNETTACFIQDAYCSCDISWMNELSWAKALRTQFAACMIHNASRKWLL